MKAAPYPTSRPIACAPLLLDFHIRLCKYMIGERQRRTTMRRVRAVLLGVMLGLGVPVAAMAAELLMIEEDGCPWCRAWDRDIGPIYDRTAEGKRAPLRRIDIHGDLPADIELASRPRFTPTFILVDEGRELGRIEGYPGEELFWWLMSDLMKRLPDGEPGT